MTIRWRWTSWSTPGGFHRHSACLGVPDEHPLLLSPDHGQGDPWWHGSSLGGTNSARPMESGRGEKEKRNETIIVMS